MSQSSLPRMPVNHDDDAQSLWPLGMAMSLLAISAIGLVLVYFGFAGDDPLSDASFWLLLLGGAIVGFVVLGMATEHRLTRHMQCALVMSTLMHVVLAILLHEQLLVVNNDPKPVTIREVEPLPQLPDYYLPTPSSTEEMAFELPVESSLASAAQRETTRAMATAKVPLTRSPRRTPQSVDATTAFSELTRQVTTATRQATDLARQTAEREAAASLRPSPIRAPDEQVRVDSEPRLDVVSPTLNQRLATSPESVRRANSPALVPNAESDTADVPRAARIRPVDRARMFAPMDRDDAINMAASSGLPETRAQNRSDVPTHVGTSEAEIGISPRSDALRVARQSTTGSWVVRTRSSPPIARGFDLAEATTTSSSTGRRSRGQIAENSASEAADEITAKSKRTALTQSATLPELSAAENGSADRGIAESQPRWQTEQAESGRSTELVDFPKSGAGEPARRSTQIATSRDASSGRVGLDLQPAEDWGVPRRRLNPQSRTVSEAKERFVREPNRSVAQMSGAARDIAPAYARRAARRNDAQRRNAGRNSPEVETTIELGLAYLASIQHEDGRWSLQTTRGPRATRRESVDQGELMEETAAPIRADTAATGLALLAFLGAGYDHIDDRYQPTIKAGLSFLEDHQQTSGDLYLRQSGEANAGIWFYSHGIAAIALCEAFGMTGDRELRDPAQRALDFIVASQHPQRGGWRYRPGEMSDLSVSGWQLMALRSGQLAGLTVPAETIERTVRLLDRAQIAPDDASRYSYNAWGNNTEEGRYGPQANTVMTSVGLLMRLYTGWNRDAESMRRGSDVLLARLPNMNRPPAFAGMANPERDTYYWYNATQVMFHMQGHYWERWRQALYPLLSETQIKTGEMAGSWNPRQPVMDRWGASAGRVYVTTMNLLSLEVYHRHLPLFDVGLLGDGTGASHVP